MDKIISILVVTIILTLAIARGRRLLIQSIVEGNTAENLSHFVPASVAARIANTEGPLIDSQTETREATILFVDLVSFTSLAERLSPEALITTLNEYFRVLSTSIEKHNGVINQFQGDAILASFNLPNKDADHTSNAIAAAMEIEQVLNEHQFSDGRILSTRTGINTGEVVGGFFGTPNRLSYTVYGDDVNIASRLTELCKKYDAYCLISERTMQLCDQQRFNFTAKGSEILRGRHNAVKIFEPTL